MSINFYKFFSEERQDLFEKIFIMFFAAINGLLVAVPGLYSEEFETLLDLFYFAQEKGFTLQSLSLVISSLILILSSIFLLFSVFLKIRQKKDLKWEWLIYCFLNWFLLLTISLIANEYFEDVGLVLLSRYVLYDYGLIFAFQLVVILVLSFVQAVRPFKEKGETVSGIVPIKDTIRLNVGERELYKIHASKMFGYVGVLVLTSERILFSGKNIFINSPLFISIPFEKIVEVKKRESKWFLNSALKIWYINEKGIKTKITFNPELYNFTKNHDLDISSVFSFVHKLYTDKDLQNQIKRGEQVTIVEQNVKMQAERTNRYVWIYMFAFIAGIAIGGIIPMLICFGAAQLIVWLLNKRSKK